MKTSKVFFLVLLCSMAFNVEAYALNEFTDDYENEDNIAVLNDIVRNPSLDAMELDEYNITIEDVPMDIWTTGGFTQVDPGANHLKNINGTEIWFDDVDRDEGDRVFKSFGAGFFNGDWEYHFRVRIASAHTSNARAYFMGFSQTSSDHYTARLADSDLITFYVQWLQVSGIWEIRLQSIDEGDITQDIEDETESFDLDKWYHVTYIRESHNTTAWFYNDALKTDLDFMLTVYDETLTDLEWFHPLCSQNQVTGGRAMDMWLNRVCNITSGIQYRPDGYFYTTDVLSGVANSIVLLTNTTIPVDDQITVAFSPDNATWVDHNGIAGSDILVAGNESVDIRDLGYSNLFMLFNMSDGGSDSTPRLYQIWVITDEDAGNGNGPSVEDRFMIGLTIGIALLLIAFIYYQTRR